MKLTTMIALTMFVLGAAALSAQDLADNPDYQQALELQQKSADASAAGDYDNAYNYSLEASEHLKKVRDAVEWERLKKEAEDLIKALNDRFAKLDAARAEKDFPDQYETATSKHTSAKAAFSAGFGLLRMNHTSPADISSAGPPELRGALAVPLISPPY